jgi:hypothetical protein
MSLRPDPDFNHDFMRLLSAIERFARDFAVRGRHSGARIPSAHGSLAQGEHDLRQKSPGETAIAVLLLSLLVAAILGLLWLTAPLVGKINLLADLPPLQKSAVASVPLGLFAVLVNRRQVRRLKETGRLKQSEALAELTRRILGRLKEPALLSARSIRGLAHGIEQSLGCPLITDKLIIEAIRAAALNLEDRHTGPELTQRLRALNALLMEIDSEAIPLLSLANVDRLTAYTRSQPFLMLALFVVLCVVGLGAKVLKLSIPSIVAYTLCVAVLIFQMILLISTFRAISIWGRETGNLHRRWYLKWLDPSQPGLLLDFFLIACGSRARWARIFWDNVWAGIWEGHLVFSPKFARMHLFRFDLARDLWRQLLAAQRSLDELPANDRTERANQAREFKYLCRKLWTVTGADVFREIEKRGQILSNDMANDVIRSL